MARGPHISSNTQARLQSDGFCLPSSLAYLDRVEFGPGSDKSCMNHSASRQCVPAAAAAVVCLLAAHAFPSLPQTAAASKLQGPSGCTLRIHVDGFRNLRGNLGTILFTSPNGWPEVKAKAFRAGPAPIDPSSRTAVAVWPNLPPGNYGVAAIHDENSNAKLDRNFLGVPKEGFGFANNPNIGFSAPLFRAALVHVTCPATEITIHLQYK